MSLRSMRRISTTGRATPMSTPPALTGRTTAQRFAALSFAAYELARGTVEGYRPQILHCHDWQAALVPAYNMYNAPTPAKTVLTVHNIAFQGRFGWDVFNSLKIDYRAANEGAIEYFGGIGYLKAGLLCADAITTVSPTYANEIRTPAFGMGLEGLLQVRADKVHGILNGIDDLAWDPMKDAALPQTFGAASIPQRAVNKDVLCGRFGIEPGNGPLFAVVSRLTWQKGLDMMVPLIDELVARGATLLVLGSGDPEIENGFKAAAARHPGKVGVEIGYDEALSHLIQARRRRDGGAVALRAVRADAIVRSALWLRAAGESRGRARRYGDRCQRSGG